MKLTILGTSAGFAGKNDGCSSYLLQMGDLYLLIDIGPGALSYLQNFIDYRRINELFVSHLHADHVSDLYTFRYAVYAAQNEGSMKKPLAINLPRSPRRTFRFIRSVIKKEFAIEIIPALKRDLRPYSVRFIRTIHPPETYSMRFEYEGKSFVYTADTAFFPELVSFCSDADLLLAEATLLEKDKDLEPLGHMTARTAGVLASKSGSHHLVLTHLWPENDKKLTEKEAKLGYRGKITIAKRGDQFEF